MIFPKGGKGAALQTLNHSSNAAQLNAGTVPLLMSDSLGGSQELREIIRCFCFAVNNKGQKRVTENGGGDR